MSLGLGLHSLTKHTAIVLCRRLPSLWQRLQASALKQAISRLPTAGVSAAIHVEHLAGYLSGPRQVENGFDNIFYLPDLSIWLPRRKRFLGTILLQ